MVRLLQLGGLLSAAALASANVQRPLALSHDESPKPISVALFSSLERMSRLVDIAYCVGTTGVSEPFSCASRCREFPTLTLATVWNTGILMSDSCGYIAVDHGERRPDADKDAQDRLGEKAIIVAFRGTYSIANTVVDLSTVPQEYVPYPSPDDGGDTPREPQHRCDNCTVHSGFLESWQQARKLVIPELQELRKQYPGYPVQLVGHSLGGAVAMLAALELTVTLGWNDTVTTTFGEPKVGNQGLSDYVDAVFGLSEQDEKDPEKRVFRRVTHVDDPVPMLPLTEWGYRPHGGEFFINKKELSPSLENIIVCHGAGDRNCVAQGDVHPDDLETVETLAQDPDAVLETEVEVETEGEETVRVAKRFPARFKLWQLFFAHRDYFWRIGLCIPGGDPNDWGRKYPVPDDTSPDEL
jgi:hypothetical protein